MPRPPLSPHHQPPVEIQTSTELAEIERNARAIMAEVLDRAQAVAQQVGYDGPISIDALDDGIYLYQRRTVEDCLELGKRLVVRRELTPHGEWTETVERLGFNDRTARRFMQAAVKTGKSAKLADLATRSRTAGHYLELLTLDDEEVAQLADGGTVAGLTMDAIDRMSVSELRKQLRDQRAEREATDKILSDKNRRIDELQTKLEKTKAQPKPGAAQPDMTPDGQRAALLQETANLASVLEVQIRGPLAHAVRELIAHAASVGQPVDELATGLLCQLERAVQETRLDLGLKTAPDGKAELGWLDEPWAQPGYVDPEDETIT